MDSTAQTALRDSVIINELLSRVMPGFDSPKGLRNHQRTVVTGDAWFRQRTAPRDSDIINEQLSWVTHGFDSPHSPRDSEIINELLSPLTHGFNSQDSP
jgi:hypothetical protein